MEGVKWRKQLYGPNGESIARVTKVPLDKQPCQHKRHGHPEPVCNMKDCWCRQPEENVAERDKEHDIVKSKNRVTWDQILSRDIPHERVPQRNRKNKALQVYLAILKHEANICWC